MKRFLVLALSVGAGVCMVQARAADKKAQAAEAQPQVVDTTVCDVLQNPAAFNGKVVRIKGTVSAGFDQFILRGPDCRQRVDGIWLSYPEGTKGKAGPDAVVELQPASNFTGKYTPPARTPVKIVKDKEFKKFDSLLSQEHHRGGICLGCRRYEVSATLVGRLDGVADATLQRDASGKIVGFGGFGNLNAYPARLVLESVSDVTPKEIDYTKSDELTKGDFQPQSGPGNQFEPMEGARKVAAEIGNSATGVQAQKDVDAFPKSHEKNGVIVSYGRINEVADTDGARGAEESPDGVLFNCTFNLNHLQGVALVDAILHMGQHIAEVRNPNPDGPIAPLYVMESNAWAITVSGAMASRQKTLTLNGGYVVWDATWTSSDISSNFSNAMNAYLTNQALLGR